jgi:AraC family transcriptional regulator
MSAITKTIWLIESRSSDPLTLDDMAAHAGVSRSHLSRIFPLATGYSISAYLRGRRLSEAAKALAGGAPDILAVALDAGYGSHEAFTRAFRDQFGITPDEVRRRRSLDNLSIVEPLPMNANTATKLPEPVIERRPAMRIAGLMGRHEMSNSNGIPQQWQRFGAYIGNVPGAVPGAAYGVVPDADESTCEYMSGVEVTASAELPKEFKVLDVPAQLYARHRHQGHISTIRSTIGAIYGQWLPQSGYRQAEGISFIENYGPDFNPATGLGTVEIWIGLED